MPGPYKKKKHHTGDTFYKRKYNTKNRKKDLDEVCLFDVFILYRFKINFNYFTVFE